MTTSYEVTTFEDETTGDIILPIPKPVLDAMGWEENDQIDITLDDKGQIVMRKL